MPVVCLVHFRPGIDQDLAQVVSPLLNCREQRRLAFMNVFMCLCVCVLMRLCVYVFDMLACWYGEDRW